jgi:hypothetical protein
MSEHVGWTWVTGKKRNFTDRDFGISEIKDRSYRVESVSYPQRLYTEEQMREVISTLEYALEEWGICTGDALKVINKKIEKYREVLE